MKIIDIALENLTHFSPETYSKMDIMKFMCPVEMGLAELECANEDKSKGLEGCINCWNREFTKN